MLLKNRRTNAALELTYQAFRKKFAKEIPVAYESYRRVVLNKCYYKLNNDNSIESNFYFDLKWNLRIGGRGLESALLRARLMPPTKHNNLSNSAWYIEKF